MKENNISNFMYLFFIKHMHHTSSYFCVLVFIQEEETDSQKA